jgi:hypothetical protein
MPPLADALVLLTLRELLADPGRLFVLGLALMSLGWGLLRLPLPRASESPRPPRRP